jgi:predicted nucleotidyltransferase component of viral defense system
MTQMNIQPGHIARHTPRNAGAQGREAAVVDIAQDLLLQHLYESGVLDSVAIKGGTAIRKLYAGNEGRFSLDLDFSVANLDADRDAVALAFASAVDGLVIGPFIYGATERRGKWSITLVSRFVSESTLVTKLDFSPAPWLNPVEKAWVPMPIHAQYGSPLPYIKTLRLEENIAEKIARLNRTTTARDMYDLAWIMNTPAIAHELGLPLVRRLAVLKIWVDTNGMHAGTMVWNPGHEGSTFDPQQWLRKRDKHEFDLEDIGALAVPTPSTEELCDAVRKGFAFLTDLSAAEQTLAHSDERDRSLAIRMLQELPDRRLDSVGLY